MLKENMFLTQFDWNLKNIVGVIISSCALLILFYFSYLNLGFQIDDALIYQRYIQNFLEGKGLVYNEGEYFNALTSPLYTYLATFISILFLGHIQFATIFLATLLYAITFITLIKLFSNYQPLPIVALGALMLVSFPYIYFVYGMETPLFLCLIALCLYSFEKENVFYLGIFCALLLVTRSEGIFLILALAVEHFRQRRPFPALKNFLIPIAIIICIFSFNKFYYGSALAETGMAKVYQGRSGLWGEFPAFSLIDYQIGWFFYNSWIKFKLIISLAILGIIGLGFSSINFVIILFLMFYTGFYVFLNIPNYHWYYAPYYLFSFFYIPFGLYWLYHCTMQVKDFIFKTLSIIALSFLIYYLSYATFNTTKQHNQIGDVNHTYKDIGVWIKENTPPTSKIALVEIGHVGLYSDRYIIDILGLVNHSNARFFGERKFSEWLKHYTPDYILVHRDVWVHEQGAGVASLLGNYLNVIDFPIKQFKLIRRIDSATKIIPSQIQSIDARLAFEEDKAVFMTHANGKIEFELPAGTYQLQGQFGILKGAYSATNPTPSDGVTFKAELAGQASPLFERNLNPLQNEQDRGILEFKSDKFRLTQPAHLILSVDNLPNHHTQSDWAFWRNVQFTPTMP